MTNDIAYFLGLWIAEGSIEENIGRITITCGDPDVGPVLESGAVFGVVFKQCNGRSDQWRANSYALLEAMRFLKMPLVKAPQKWLPEFVWSGKRLWAQHLLSGMFDGDGYICRVGTNRGGYTTASEQLAHDVQLLLTNFGIISRLSARTSLPTTKVRVASLGYRVEIHGKNLSLLKGVLKLRIKRKADLLNGKSDELFSRRDGVPILPVLRELKKLAPGEKRPVLAAAINIASSHHKSDTTYETIFKVLTEYSEFSSAKPYVLLKQILEDHFYWDVVTA